MKPIIEDIERGVSQTSEIVRTESKGSLNGRLDIAVYLARRGTNLSWPKSLPVLVAKASANTPENQLVVDALRQLIRRLNEATGLIVSAERNYSLNLLRWARERLHATPWQKVLPARSSTILRRETEHRLRKRQTGNQAAYGRLAIWYGQWTFDATLASPDLADRMVDLMLAFPAGEFFADRVFEVWCLNQVIESFRRIGAVTVEGPRLLWQRAGRSICTLRFEEYTFDVWFQKSLPSSSARWRYVHSGNALKGIPDITLIGEDSRYLVIDAKNRKSYGATRPEETYKMLGYLENFRGTFQQYPFWGALCFLSDDDLFTEVGTEGGNRLVLLGAHDNDPKVCALGGRMDTLLSEWLSLRRTEGLLASAPVPQIIM
ncbi:hypothetical protein [Granulicella aggregans]|uniref:hypothetical protein n=1 Tax=Granulicella aggregans TaxID=474949 RepID=UPI0016168437|nr:hypothetical protein [Granulicella aggregans]